MEIQASMRGLSNTEFWGRVGGDDVDDALTGFTGVSYVTMDCIQLDHYFKIVVK